MRNFIDNLRKCNSIFSKEQKQWTICVFILSVIGSAFEMVGVSSILPFADVLIQPEEAYLNPDYLFLVQWLGLQSAEQLILLLSIIIAIIYVVKNVYYIFLAWVRAKYVQKLDRELSVKMMKSYMSKGYIYFSNTNTGSLMRGIQTDVGSAKLVVYNTMKLITDVMSVLLIAVYLIMVDWELALGVGLMAAVCFVVIGRVFSQMTLKAGKTSRIYQAKANQNLLQALQGVKEVLVLKKEEFFTKVYSKNYAKQLQADRTRIICSEIPAYIIEGACVAVIFFIICVKIIVSGISDELLPVLASFVVAAFKILPAIGKTTSEYSAIKYYYAGLDAVYNNFLEISDEGNDRLLPNLTETKEDKIIFQKNIQLKDVVFAYDANQKNIIDHLNLTIIKGESVAFVGPSGSGKTTLADIVLGLLKPQKGEILVDGKDVLSSPLGWSQMVGYVSQTIYLVDDTIRVNVAFGVDEEDIDDERVWECLRRAQIDDYVKKMEQDIYTTVGDRGVKISGGQRQRIAIARALYHNPQILVLDEATSALDNDTEKAVMESIDALQGEITMIIVAHRLSTVKNCNHIYEINNGIAVEKDKAEIFLGVN